MYKWYQVLLQDLGKNMDGNLAWLSQKTEDPKSNKEREPYFSPRQHKCDWTGL